MPLICAALALLVWVAGLNLYAGQLAGQGQSLQRQSSQRACSRPSRNCRWCSIRCAEARERRDAYLAGKADGDAVPGLASAAAWRRRGDAVPRRAPAATGLPRRRTGPGLLPGPPGGDAAAWRGRVGQARVAGRYLRQGLAGARHGSAASAGRWRGETSGTAGASADEDE
ncbi:GspL/Epsl periplasmic domain-containing protein [Pseudomonas aeruginosa]